MHAAHFRLAAGRPWSCMPKWQYGDIVDLIVFFVFKIPFLPKYRVNYYDYLLVNLRSPRDCGSCRRAVVPFAPVVLP